MTPAPTHPFMQSSFGIFLSCIDKGDMDGASFCLEATSSFCADEKNVQMDVIKSLFARYKALQKENEVLCDTVHHVSKKAQELTDAYWHTSMELCAVKKCHTSAIECLECRRIVEQCEDNRAFERKYKKIEAVIKEQQK